MRKDGNLGLTRGGVEPGRARAACGRRNRHRKRPEAGGESCFIRKKPESGDGRSIRSSESRGEAEKTDLGSQSQKTNEQNNERL